MEFGGFYYFVSYGRRHIYIYIHIHIRIFRVCAVGKLGNVRLDWMGVEDIILC